MKKPIVYICIALVVGVIIGVLLCFVLHPFASGSSAQDINKPSVTTGFVDKTLVGTYTSKNYDISLYADGTGEHSNFGHIVWLCYDNFVHISRDDEYEMLFFIVDNGLVYNQQLYAKQ